MKPRRGMGWAIPVRLRIRRLKSQFVEPDIVCSCERHQRCAKRGQCGFLDHCVMSGHLEVELLLRWTKIVPMEWRRGNLMWRNPKQWRLRSRAVERVRRRHFEMCRPVTVEVRAR
jgi:hypothetical protein